MGKRLFMAAATLLMLAVFGVSAAWAGGPTRCTGPEGPVTIKGNVTAGPGCNLSGTTVEGNVTVEPGGNLTTEPGTTTVITGNVQGNKATLIQLEGKTSIGANLQLTGTTERIEILSGTVKGNVQINSGIAFLTVENENIAGNVQLQNNTGGFGLDVNGSTIGGNVQLSNNSLSDLVTVLFVIGDSVGGNVQVGNNSLSGPELNFVFVNSVSVHGNAQVYNNSLTGGLPALEVQEDLVEANIRVTNNTEEAPGELFVFTNTVKDNLQVNGNKSSSNNVVENTVTTSLQCQNNEPPPTDLGVPNKAKLKQGQCVSL
jgi:hypothetical protein